MKSIRTILFALSVALLASCQANEIDKNAFSGPATGDKPQFTAGFEDVSPSETKVYLNSDIKTKWNADDRISIFTVKTVNLEYRYTGPTGQDKGNFSQVTTDITETGEDISANYAVYPYDSKTAVTGDGVITLDLPAVQQFGDKSYGLRANTMVAATSSPTDYVLKFKNLCGYLVVRLYGEGKVNSIVFEGNKGEKIAGKATVKAAFQTEPVTKMSEDATSSISIDCKDGITLSNDPENPTDFWFCIPPVSFERGFKVTIADDRGFSTVYKTNSYKVIYRNRGTYMEAADAKLEPVAVDLGLSVKWAPFNVGANNPEEFGDFFAWGETSPKKNYSNSEYKWSAKSSNNLKKYCTDPVFGTVDSKTVLDAADDAANVNWGGDWRMPSEEEMNELVEKCRWDWTTVNKVAGFLVTSKVPGYESRSIFLPATGYIAGKVVTSQGSEADYWTSTVTFSSPYSARTAIANSKDGSSVGNSVRSIGNTVRPVLGKRIDATELILDRTSYNPFIGESFQLVATLAPSNCNEKNVSWKSSNTKVAEVSNTGVVTPKKTGTATITASWAGNNDIKATCELAVEEKPSPTAVDLGLSVKWATFNVGTLRPEEPGEYYAWGEISDKEEYIWSTYKWWQSGSNSDNLMFNKYNASSGHGVVDDKECLDPSDDVAKMKWAGKWRMPTIDEISDLVNKCSWTWTTLNGVEGYRISGRGTLYKDNWIFIPASGMMDGTKVSYPGDVLFWSTAYVNTVPSMARGFWASGKLTSSPLHFMERYTGIPVRPVCDK